MTFSGQIRSCMLVRRRRPLAPSLTISEGPSCLSAVETSFGSPPLRRRPSPCQARLTPGIEADALADSGRHRFHWAASGPLRAVPRTPCDHLQPRSSEGRLARPGRGTARRSQRRLDSSGGSRLGRLHRQCDQATGLGPRGGARTEGPCRPVHLHLDHLGLCGERQARRRDRPARGLQGRRSHGRDNRVAEREPKALRAPEGGVRNGGADAVWRECHHHHPTEPDRGAGR